MSQEKVAYTIYTCDRCITKAKGEDTKAWSSINQQLKSGASGSVPNYTGDLCSLCTADFDKWWKHGMETK